MLSKIAKVAHVAHTVMYWQICKTGMKFQVYNWICGFSSLEEEDEEPIDIIKSVYQSRKMKYLTRINSAVIISFGVTLYILFSCGRDL